MRMGGIQGVVALLLMVLGGLLVLGALAAPFVATQWTLANVVLMLLIGATLWRAGHLLRLGRTYGYHLAVAAIVVLTAAPFLFGTHPAMLATALEILLLLLVLESWRRVPRAPGA